MSSVHPDDAWRDPDGVLVHARQASYTDDLCNWSALTWMSLSDRIDAVRIYARLGMHPILLWGVRVDGTCTCGQDHFAKKSENSIGKHPVYTGWQRAQLNVPDLLADLERDWRFNIGLRMGMQPNGSRLIAIDVDGERSLLADLEAKNGALPPTLTATSGKGMHLIFRLPEGMEMPKNKVHLAPGVDVRSEGGQVVAAPSRHRSGRFYKWLEVREPAELPL